MAADKVAVVGYAARLPGAGADLGLFWQNLVAGRDASGEVPAGRWVLPPERCVQPGGAADTVPHARGYFLDDIPTVDGLPAGLDPLFHLVADVGGRAFAAAKTDAIDRRRAGVVLGNICLPTSKSIDLAAEVLGRRPGRTEPLNRYVAGLPAGLLAKSLGLGGGSVTLDAACASSLYAVKLACDELLAGRADLMLAGGGNRADSLYTSMGFTALKALSPSGRCSPFGAAADGLMVGEGAVVFALKRLADALRDGDTVHGVVAGWGLSNDLAGSLLAPAKEGQLRAMRSAYQAAGWKVTHPEVVECHATGTPVGDAVEFDSLRTLWGDDGWQPGQCSIGSVKSGVGHLLTGAGAAALLKVLLGIRHKRRPPQANFDGPAGGLKYDGGPFQVLTQADAWEPRRPTAPRRAAVSGFGFGGVNAHLLVEEYVGQTFAGGSGSSSVSWAKDDTPEPDPTAPIAVVGMGVHVGPWVGLRAFQEFTLGGGESHPPAAKAHGWADAVRPCPPGHFIEKLSVRLDRFRIPPKELEELLPQQLLMLQVAADALADCSGATPAGDDPRAGVFVGLGLDPNTTNYSLRWAELASGGESDLPQLTADRTMGALGSIAASRVARAFRFGGPSFTLCSEEASAGRAVELAVRALRLGELDRAVAGGVDLAGDPRLVLPGNVRLPADGAVAVVLKRLSDAERDGDRVYAVIRGVGVATGTPDPTAFASSLRRAARDANGEVTDFDHVEAADWPGEADAAGVLIAAGVSVGAVGRQVGRAGAATAGCGLVKACLALHHRILPPSDATLGGAAASQPRFWLADAEPRRAAVTAAGADGSVVQILLEEHAAASDDPQPLGATPEAVFAVEHADLAAGLAELTAFATDRGGWPVERLAREWFATHPPQPASPRAFAFVARSAAELVEQVGHARAATPAIPFPASNVPDLRPATRDRVFYSPAPLDPAGKLAVVFPGSGNQFAGMGRELGVRFPGVLRRQQAESSRLRGQYAPDLFWADAVPPSATARQFLFGQVTLGTLTSDTLLSLGVIADALVGQSLGESAGLFGLRVWAGRDDMLGRVEASSLFGPDLGPPFDSARRFWGVDNVDWVTGVLPVAARRVRVRLMPGSKAYVLIATTPAECVVGGERAEVMKLVGQFDAPFVPLDGVTLAHCEAGRPVERAYRELHTLPTAAPPGLTVYSGARGTPYDPSPANCADSITAGLVGPIDFPAVVERAYADGVRVFVEAGPGNSVTRQVAATLTGRPHLARAVTAPRQDAVSLVLRLVANLIAERRPVDLAALYGGPARCVGHLPPPPADAGPRMTVPVGRPPVRAAEVDEPGVVVAGAERGVVERADRVEVVALLSGTPSADPFIAAVAATATAAAEAHDVFLRLQAGFSQLAAAAVGIRMHVLASGGRKPAEGTIAEGPTVADTAIVPSADFRPPLAETTDAVPRSLTTEQCFTYAHGKIADVLGPRYAEIDAFPTRVRLPDGPLMLVDRVLGIEGEPLSLTRGRVETDHHVHAGRWYLDSGRIPVSIAVESGQADLLLSGFLGIDLRTRGLAVYRLIDAVVTFHRELPRVGDTVRYDIHIDEFRQQGGAWLFRFRFEGYVGDHHLMTMRDGVAGFFTAEQLAAGEGVKQTKLDRQPMPGIKPADWHDLVPQAACSLDVAGVNALRRGDLVGAFGADFAAAELDNPQRLPGGLLRLIDRVPTIDPTGGRFGLGFVRAEYDVKPDDWFLACHFVDDQVMPGTLMFECCLHTLRVFLTRLGWVGEDGAVVYQPVPGRASRLRCRGQVTAGTTTVAYEVTVREVGYGPEPYAVADALMFADGKPVVEIGGMSVRLTGLTRDKLDAIWASGRRELVRPGAVTGPAHAGRSPEDRKPAVYDKASILAYSNGRPSEAFGQPYRVFDRDRVIARLPGPPYQFLDRITAVTGEPFVLKAGAACEAQYDVSPDAWYFAADRSGAMPFSVLLEVALQPCGWLAAYCGSALTSDTDLSFRNLGGKATQHRRVTPGVGMLTVNVALTGVSHSAGMIIQHYSLAVTAGGQPVYDGTTYFGFFAKDALANQVGMPAAKVPFLTAGQKAESVPLPHAAPFPDAMLRMVDRVDGYLPAGGKAGLGLVQGSILVDPGFWFFKAHFYQDPVWPGSLGLESFLQLLKYAAVQRWGVPVAGWQAATVGQPHSWTYRGQVLSTDALATVVLEVTAVDDARHRLTADGHLTVDGRVIYQMTDFGLEWL